MKFQAKSERGSVLMKQGRVEEARAQFTDLVRDVTQNGVTKDFFLYYCTPNTQASQILMLNNLLLR